MKHARSDYDRIQDPLRKIGDTEPVFLLRGQDVSAPETLRKWAELNTVNGGQESMSERALEWANKMEEYQKATRAGKASDCPEPYLRDSII